MLLAFLKWLIRRRFPFFGRNAVKQWGYRLPPERGVVCRTNNTALLGEAALFSSGHECISPFAVAPSGFDRLISGYRLSGGPLFCSS